MTAGEKYRHNYETIESQLTHIRALINDHCAEVVPHYGHVGDLAHVVSELAEVIEFLGGNRNAATPNKFWSNNGSGYQVVTIPE